MIDKIISRIVREIWFFTGFVQRAFWALSMKSFVETTIRA